jgi:hypothetical protein
MKALRLCVLFLLACTCKIGLACTVTLSPGTNVVSSGVSSASTGATICLNTGAYSESNQIQLKQGQTLKGLGTYNTDARIESSFTNAIVTMTDNTQIEKLFIKSTISPGNQVGIDIGYATSAVIWDVKISYVVDPIHVYASDWVGIYSVHTENNGNPNSVWYDGLWQQKPDPSIYIWGSSNIEILYGWYEGSSNGPGGDGEIQCAYSTNFLIDGAHIVNTGASNAYFNNCDNATITNAVLTDSDEWGIDVVNGSTNFTAINNTVINASYGGAVFEESTSGLGTFNSNTFITNNLSHSRTCEGVNVIGNVSNVDVTPSNTMYYDSFTALDDAEICSY